MKELAYRILFGIGFWYLFSPFVLKTAGSLAARGLGVFLGTLIIIVAYFGYKKQVDWAGKVLLVFGVASIVLGVAVGRIMHAGGTFHDIIIGILIVLVSLIALRYPPVTSAKAVQATAEPEDDKTEFAPAVNYAQVASTMSYREVARAIRELMRGPR